MSNRLGRLMPDRDLLHRSGVVFAGLSVARMLGFLFAVAAARLLAPADFGRLSYALALAALASVLISAAPCGLSRYLSRHHDDEALQKDYASAWLAVVAALLAVSLVIALPAAALLGLGVWIVFGIAANVVGVAVIESYKESQRGLDRFTPMAVGYALANLVQLAGVLGAATLGWRSPAVFVIIYGLSDVVACALLQMFAPLHLGVSISAVTWKRMREVERFIRPLLLQSVFFAVWLTADIVLVKHLLGAAATGNYGAAKVLANAVWLPPAAIGTVLVPRVARLDSAALRRYVPRVIGLACLVTVPCAVGLAVLAHPITALTFGSRYPEAAAPLGLLGLAMGLHGLYMIPFGLWIGLGRPTVDMVSTGVGMVVTIAAAALLIPVAGLTGAGAGFCIGSAARLAVISGFTAWALYLRRSARSSSLALEPAPISNV